MQNQNRSLQSLETDSVAKVFFRYLIPSLIGMFMMSINVVIDGIFVGHRFGSVALAGINVSFPVFSIYMAISLWIGIGGAALYSKALGAKQYTKAQSIFTHSLTLIFSITIVIGFIAFMLREPVALFLGANEETMPYVMDYMNVLLSCGFVFTVQNSFSVFVRNDGNPNLAMISMVVTAISNVILNYIFLFVLDFGVAGSAWGLIGAAAIGSCVLFTHFLRKESTLKFSKPTFSWELTRNTLIIGFPSFIAEVGIAVFTAGYNIAMAHWVGTVGVSAFSILNYVHSVMLMMFIGMGSAIQPLISFYRGAKQRVRERETIRIAVKTALGTGIGILLVGIFAADAIVSMFGDFSADVRELAITGIRLFFIAYLFMGINFVMMTYFQATEQVKMAIWITIAREMLLMIAFLFTLPHIWGINGIWLAIPLSECIVTLTVYLYIRNQAARALTASAGLSR
ncbi:MATE family efflux transporter [Paenibacillus radicis (ex Xue et al. 2023)]|uniref:Multidrug export protein MepA n=1 Tax=Paenibacillus radicis (ex Xue et al. 2023) TaxID=2972489 RepID=A0ABT1YUJ9_9BACL|nr:MATE family efflux transporter [Paenibacillus radicis (ex Xue et al. 2023)]MCR8636650.1 MATE family efflux transporter [Paenibacillus radicis (ex Xue et al. 2023)]